MSQHTITIGSETIPVHIRTHARSKRLRMTITHAKEIVITIPRWTSARAVEAFIDQHLAWIEKTRARLQASTLLPGPGDAEEYARLKASALLFVQRRISELNTHYGFSFNRLTIRNQRSRWGSCSSKGNLNFSYRVVLLPPHFADYIIVHELCHLREHNHSQRFWDLVAETIPDYQSLRRQLRTGAMKDD